MCVCVCVFVSLFCWDLPKESLNSKEKDYTAKTARKTRARNESLRPIKRKRGISTGKVTKTKRSQNNDNKSKPKSNNLNKHQKK